MATTMPDEILEATVCSSCKKYLSVKPIKIYPNHQIKCGRCAEDGDNGVESLYGLFAEEILFPCINRYEGCQELLKHSEVKTHERDCPTGFYPCLLCDKFRGPAYDLISHFKLFHKNNMIHSDVFPVNTKVESMEDHYLYRQKNFVFLVEVKCDTISKELLFKMTFIGPEEKGNYLKYHFIFYDFKNNTQYTTGSYNCLPFGKNAELQRVKFDDLCKEGKLFICQIKTNISECEGLVNYCQELLQKEVIDRKTNRQKIEDTASRKSDVLSVKCDKLQKSNQSTPLYLMNEPDLNNDIISLKTILESPVRSIFKQQLRLNSKTTCCKGRWYNISLSKKTTSIILESCTVTKKKHFEMVCYGCKQNLPVFKAENYEDLQVSYEVYGCPAECPHNLVCENCYNFNFKVCQEEHHYAQKELEMSTIRKLLYQYDWNNKFHSNKVRCLDSDYIPKYCHQCRRTGIDFYRYFSYKDFMEDLLKLNLNVVDIGLLIYHGMKEHDYSFNSLNFDKHKLFWLLPLVTHKICLSDLLFETFVAIVDTLIVVEQCFNAKCTTLKVKFYKPAENENKSIATIVKFKNDQYKIFRGDFQILNDDIPDTYVSFRII